MIPLLGTLAGAVVGALAINLLQQPLPGDEIRRPLPKHDTHLSNTQTPAQSNAQKERYAQKQSQSHPRQEAAKAPPARELLEQAKDWANAGDVATMRQGLAELENRIEKDKQRGIKNQDAMNARSLLLSRLKSASQPQAATAARESYELKVAMGEAMA